MPQWSSNGVSLRVPSRPAAPANILRGATGAGPLCRAAAAAVESLEGRVLLSTYYVSTFGNDANVGTSLAHPFRTIQRAANVARPGDTVLVRGGTYRETVKPAHSGKASARITFKPYDNEPVTISGADVVSGWDSHKGPVYKARQTWDLGPGANQVFIDGQMLTEARWPNTSLDVSRPTKASADRFAGGTLYDSALTQPDGTWDGATIHLVPGQGWVAQTGKVTRSSRGKLTFTYKPMGADAVPEPGDPYYLTGKFVALDAPGEWFRDPGTKQLYLWAPDGGDPGGHAVEAKRRPHAFDLSGRSYIDVAGFRLFAAGVATNPKSSDLRLTGLDARYVSHYTALETGWSRDHETGISLEGENHLIADSVIAYSAGHGIVLAGRNSRAENNVILDTAYAGADEAPIRTEGEGQVVAFNTIRRAGRSGIKVSNTTRVKVLNNDVRDVMLQTTDGGGVYTYGMDGNGSEIAYNLIAGVHTGGWGGVGVFLDNYSAEYLVHHNVVWDVDHALKMNPPSRDNQIYNNTLVGDDTSVETNRGRDMAGSVFRNNIFTRPANIGSVSQQNNLYAGTDPRFASAATGDFRLSDDSPAIDRGDHLGAVTVGYAGRSPDAGAYEFGRPAFAAGADLDVPLGTTPPPPPPAPAPPDDGDDDEDDDEGGETPVPTPVPAPVPPPVARGRWDARKRIEAERYDAQSGIRRATYSIGYAEGGDWLRFDDVDFGAGVNTFHARLALDKRYAGKQIEVRTGRPDGPLAGTLTTKGTGGWDTYATQKAAVKGLKGVQDLYIVFRNSTKGIANVDWVTFS